MTTVTAQALLKLRQRVMERNVWREKPSIKRPRKTGMEGADVTCWGRLFQVRAEATGKARSPTVDSRVRRTVSDDEEVECSRALGLIGDIRRCLIYTAFNPSVLWRCCFGTWPTRRAWGPIKSFAPTTTVTLGPQRKSGPTCTFSEVQIRRYLTSQFKL